MDTIITSLVLGSMYGLIALSIVIYFQYAKFLHVAIIGYSALGAYLTAQLSRSIPFIIGLLLSILIVSVVAFVVDHFLLLPINETTSSSKVVTSIGVLFIILTLIGVFWPASIVLNNPIGSNAIDAVTIITFIGCILGYWFFTRKTALGKSIRAFSQDREVASSYGISKTTTSLAISLITSILTVIAGVLLASEGSPRAGTSSVIFFALISISVVIFARHSHLKLAIVGAFVIALIQTVVAANIQTINDIFHDILNTVGIDTTITLGPTFADRFLPFGIAIASLLIIPKRWVGDND